MTLRSLIARVEAATGPDREIDGEVLCAVRGIPFVRWDGAGLVWQDDFGIRHTDADHVPRVTESVDAVLAIVPEGYSWHLWSVSDGLPNAELRPKGGGSPIYGLRDRRAPPALALLAAVLRAME